MLNDYRSTDSRIIPMPNPGWVFFSFSLLPLASLLLLLAGCEPKPPASVTQAPATEVPRGIGSLTSPGDKRVPSNQTPLAQWLASFEQMAQVMELPAYVIGPTDAPLIAAVALHYDDFTPVIVVHPSPAPTETSKPSRTPGGVSAWAAVAQQQVAVVGSSFLSLVRTLEPLGLLKVEGELISELEIHGYTRVLGVNDQQQLTVVHRSEVDTQTFSSALQAGPGIIERGLLDISSKDLERPRYFRSFVATCTNRVLIGVTLVPMNLRTVGEALLQAAYQHHLGCDEVINLAGDREAVFALRSDNDILYHGDPISKKAALIGFRRRTTSP